MQTFSVTALWSNFPSNRPNFPSASCSWDECHYLILQMGKKLKKGEVICGHTVFKWQNYDSNHICLIPKAVLLISCGKQNNASPKDSHILIPETCERVALHDKRDLQVWLRSGSWDEKVIGLLRWVTWNHKGPYKRKAGGSISRRRGDREAEVKVRERLEDGTLLVLKTEEGAKSQLTLGAFRW